MAKKSLAQLEQEAAEDAVAATAAADKAAATKAMADTLMADMANGTVQPDDGCIFMVRDGVTAEVAHISVPEMEAQGWAAK